MEMANLLWRYYVINGRFTDASLVLSELADATGFVFRRNGQLKLAYTFDRLTLKKRIEYLTMAVSNARSASSGDFGSSSSILSSLVDSLDVGFIALLK